MSRITDRYAEASADGEIVSTRVFDAPREVVFRAFTDPALLARWWGPKGFTNTFHEFDPRPGGAWRFVMHGPDGTDYPMTKDFVEVVPPERIVLQHIQAMHKFRMVDGVRCRDRRDAGHLADAIRVGGGGGEGTGILGSGKRGELRPPPVLAGGRGGNAPKEPR